MFNNYETEKITRKASDAAENLHVRFFRPRSSYRTHLMLFSERLPICVVHDDLGWKNRTARYKCRFSAASLVLRVIFSGGTTEQHVIIGSGELAAVDYNTLTFD